MTSNTTYSLTDVDAREATALLTGADISTDRVLKALVKAERNGADRIGDIIITHTGYQAGTSNFDAGHAIYRITTR